MIDPVAGTRAEVSSSEGAEDPVSTETPRPERVVVKPDADSRLEALHSLYEPLKKAAAEAQRALDECKAGIAAELEAQYPKDERPTRAYVVPGSIYGPELVVYYKSQEYLPSGVIKENFPAIYDAFKREKKFTEVRAAQTGRGGRRK